VRSGELFAGYGGLALAIEEVFDAETVWVSEFDKAPSRILAQRFPDAPNLGDVTKVAWHKVPRIDILGGGSPCQDLSHGGKRAGMKDGTRSGLWASMCDAIEIIRPRFVVWENVRGALSAEATAGDVESCEFCVGDDGEPPLRALGRVLGDLAELGYDAAWVGLRAADVGAPHGRFRVFVLAWDAAAQPANLGHERAGFAREGRSGSTDGRGSALTPTPAAHEAGGTVEQYRARFKDGRQSTFAPLALTIEQLLPTPRATDGTKGGPNQRGSSGDLMMPAAVQPERFGAYAEAVARWESVLGRPAPAPTEPTGKGGAHRLSPRFVEFMMGLPDGWVTDTDTTRNEQLKALGNGVVPQQAVEALRYLLSVREAALEST